MKRFYKQVEVSPERTILLDGKPVRTPKRATLALVTDALAAAVAAEWAAQGDKVDPRLMPLTGLANAAIDIVAADPLSFGSTLAAYGESDLLCYRAGDPADLVERQAAEWDPWLAWARQRFDVDFVIVTGIIHQPQPQSTIDRLASGVAARSAFALAGLAPLVTIGGSLIVALAMAERVIDAETAFDLCHLDELWQAEKWGEDYFATQTRDAHRAEFIAAARFLRLFDEAADKTD
jgi:chaperone required for assembly of F1-ATPase